MLRRALDAVTHGVAALHRRQRVRPASSRVKVNLGSGLRVVEGWVNVDSSLNALVSRWPEPLLRGLYRLTSVKQWYSPDDYLRRLREGEFVHHELAYGVPFPDDSVDFLYSSHCLEHFYRDDAEVLLRDALRVLKPGGTLRIVVPDLEHAIGLYHAGRKEEALELFFTTRETGDFSRHRYLYDYELLRDLLLRVGFGTVERRGYAVGVTPDIEQLDNRPEQSLYVEATKER